MTQFERLLIYSSGFPSCAQQIAVLRKFIVKRSASYGTGGTIDFADASDPRGGAYITALTQGGHWVILYSPATGRPSIGTIPPSRAPYTHAITAAIRALRKRDCKTFYQWVLTGPGETAAALCAAAFKSQSTALIDANPSAQPLALGGNRLVQFYGMSVGKHYYTFPVLGPPPTGPQQYVVIPPLAAR